MAIDDAVYALLGGGNWGVRNTKNALSSMPAFQPNLTPYDAYRAKRSRSLGALLHHREVVGNLSAIIDLAKPRTGLGQGLLQQQAQIQARAANPIVASRGTRTAYGGLLDDIRKLKRRYVSMMNRKQPLAWLEMPDEARALLDMQGYGDLDSLFSGTVGQRSQLISRPRGMEGFIQKQIAGVPYAFAGGEQTAVVVPSMGGRAWEVGQGPLSTQFNFINDILEKDFRPVMEKAAKSERWGSYMAADKAIRSAMMDPKAGWFVSEVDQKVLSTILQHSKEWLGTATPMMELTPHSGLMAEGVRVPMYMGGKGMDPIKIMGLPKPLINKMLTEHEEYRDLRRFIDPRSVRQASFVVTPKIVVSKDIRRTAGGVGKEVPVYDLEGPSETIRRNLYGAAAYAQAAGKQITSADLNRAIYQGLEGFVRYEGEPYAQFFYGQQGEIVKRGANDQFQTLKEEIQRGIREAGAKATGEGALKIQTASGMTVGYSASTFIHEKQRQTTANIARFLSGYKGVSVFPVKDLDAVMKRGQVFRKSLSEMFAFGSYEDPGRAPLQRVRVGRLAPEALGLLKSFDYDAPLVSSLFEEAAEEFHRVQTGAPSGAITKVGMILEEEGKTPFNKIAFTEQGEIITDKLTALAMTRDVSANQTLRQAALRKLEHMGNLTEEEIARKMGAQGIKYESMFHQGNFKYGTNVMLDSLKATIKGVSDLPGGLNVLMSQINVHSKYPAWYRRMMMTSILESIGPRSSNRTVAEAQTTAISEISKIIGVKGDKTSIWKQDTAGREVPHITFQGTEQLGLTQYRDISQVIDAYNEKLPQGARRARKGFDIRERRIPVSIKGGRTVYETRKVLEFYTKMHLREHSHNLSGILNAAAPTDAGFVYGSKRGQKITELMLRNIRRLGYHSADKVAKQLEDIRTAASRELAYNVQRMLSPLGGSEDQYVSRFIDAVQRHGIETPSERVLRGFSELRNTFNVRPLPNRMHVESIADLAGTMLDPSSALYDQYHTVRLDKPFYLRWKERIKGTEQERKILVKDLPLPRMKEFEDMLKYGEQTGDFYYDDVIKSWNRFLTSVSEGQRESDVIAHYQEALYSTYDKMIGKEGSLRRIVEPRVSGSIYAGVTGSFRTPEQAKIYKGSYGDFGSVGVSKEMAKKFGILDMLQSAKEDQSVYGLLTRYPEQAAGNTLAVKLYLDEHVQSGTISILNEFMAAMYGDLDADSASLLVSPYKSGTQEFENFQAPIRQLFEDLEPQYREKVAATSRTFKRLQGKDIGEVKRAFLDPTQLFEQEATAWNKVMSEYGDLLASTEPNLSASQTERLMEGFRSAHTSTKASLLNFVSQEGLQSGAGRALLQQMGSTKGATGLVVTALGTLSSYLEVAPTVDNYKMLLGSAGKKARAEMNASIFIGNAIQEGSIKKAELSKIDFLMRSERFLETGKRQEIDDYITRKMASQIYDYIPGDSTGLEYMSKGLRGLEREIVKSDITQEQFVEEVVSGKRKQILADIQDTRDYLVNALKTMREEGKLFKAAELEKLMGNFPVSGGAPERSYIGNLSNLVSDAMEATIDEQGNLVVPGSDSRTRQLQQIFHASGLGDFDQWARAREALQQAEVEAEKIAGKTQALDTFMDTAKSEGLGVALAKSSVGKWASDKWDWIVKGPTKPDKYYDMKRIGVLGAAGLFGAAVVKSALFPNIVPEEEKSPYVDMAPPNMSAGVSPGTDVHTYSNRGGHMPSVSPRMGEPIGEPEVAVEMGPGMKPAIDQMPSAGYQASAPMPPPPMDAGISSPSPMHAGLSQPVPRMEVDYDMFSSPVPGSDVGQIRASMISAGGREISVDMGREFSYNTSQSPLSVDRYSL